MTIITGKGLNVTGFGGGNNRSGKNNKLTDIENQDPLATEEDEFDVQEIQKIHLRKQQEEEKKNAFGMSHNIFDVSSYGEVHLKQHMVSSGQIQKGGYDASVSLVQMQDSMAFDDIKAMKKNTNANMPDNEPILEENSQNQSKITGQFERSIDNSRVNQSQAHYMEVA